MNKIILVIGSVTAKQYEPVRLELIRKGHKPNIVKVTFSDFFLGSVDLVEKFYGEDPPSYEFPTNEMDRMAESHVKSYGDLAAIVLDEHSHIYMSYSYNITRVLKSLDIDRWVARKDGGVEFV